MKVSFKNRPVAKKIFKDASWLSTIRILQFISVIFVGSWVARYLGTSDFGKLSFAIAIITLISPLGRLGIDHVIIKNIVNYPNDTQNIVVTTAITKLAFSLLCYFLTLIYGIFSYSYSDPIIFSLLCITALTTIIQSMDAIQIWFQAKGKNGLFVLCRNVGTLFSIAIRVYFIVSGKSVYYFAAAVAIEAFIVFFLLFMVYLKLGEKFKLTYFSFSKAKELISEGKFFWISSFISIIYLQVDFIILENLMTAGDIGIFSAAHRLTVNWNFIAISAIVASLPSIIQSKNEDPALYEKRTSQLLSAVLYSGFGISMAFYFLSDLIINGLFGMAYLSSIEVLKVLIWCNLFYFLNIFHDNWNLVEKRANLTFIRVTLSIFIKVVISIIWIPKVGLIALAYANLVSLALPHFIVHIFDFETRRLLWLQLKALLPINLIK